MQPKTTLDNAERPYPNPGQPALLFVESGQKEVSEVIERPNELGEGSQGEEVQGKNDGVQWPRQCMLVLE